MPNKEKLKRNTLLDWQNEKKYQEKRMKDPRATAEQKAAAKKRIAEADSNIKKLKSGK